MTEIDFRVYDDAREKYVHVTASIYHPAGRRFLESVVLKEKSDDLRKTITEYLVSPLKLALLGRKLLYLDVVRDILVPVEYLILLTVFLLKTDSQNLIAWCNCVVPAG